MSENNEYPVFGFGLEQAGNLVYCEVTMKESRYEIAFDGVYIADIQMNDEMEWMLSAGALLPQETIDEIGYRIISKYS